MKRASDQLNEYELNLGMPGLDLNMKMGQDPAKAKEANSFAAGYRKKVEDGLRNSTTDTGHGASTTANYRTTQLQNYGLTYKKYI